MLKNVRQRFTCIQIRSLGTQLFKDKIFITAAVRTPTVSYKNVKISQLANIVISEVLKRATVPSSAVNKLLLRTTCSESELMHIEANAKKLGISSTINSSQNHVECTTNLLEAVLTLQRATNSCIIVSDVHTQIGGTTGSSADSKASYRRNMMKGGLFSTDIVPVTHLHGRNQVSVDRDEDTSPDAVGAAAIMLAGAGAVKRLNLQPLAQLIGIQKSDVNEQAALEHLCRRANMRPEQICNYSSTQTSITHLLAQLTHTLPPGGYGCAVVDNETSQATAFLIERFSLKQKSDTGLAELTLYTKNPCMLCDELMAELEENFRGRYVLNKVYIDDKRNLRFLRLYRHDIPVLFLNGEFICMHRLNVKLLRHKMRQHLTAQDDEQ